MQGQKFLQKMQNLSGGMDPEIAEIVTHYPFFYTARVLNAMQLKAGNAILFEVAIRTTALMSPNREVLKCFMDGPTNIALEKKQREVFVSPANLNTEQQAVVPIEINTEPAVLEQIASYPELVKTEQLSEGAKGLMVETPEPKMTFSSWLKQMGRSVQHIETPSSEERDREALIRKFIETEPQISKPQKASFYSAVEMARKSTEERDDIVSETLARVYVQQGDLVRATRIYQKLCLLYPEKSSYFAALIKNLTTTL
jgi:hypothetical protein